MVIYLGSLVQSCCEEGGTMPTNINGMCGEFCSVSATLGLPPFTACVLSQSTLLRLQADLQGNCLKPALGCVQVLGYSTKAQTLLGLRFVPFPGPRSSGDQVRGECSLSRGGGTSYHLPGPSSSVSWVAVGVPVSGVPCVSSGELISGCDPPGGCQPSRIPGSLG